MKTHSFTKNKSHQLLFGIRTMISRFSLVVTGCLLLMQAQGQSDKRLTLADQYFAAGEYFTAAGLYGQFLHPAVKPKVHSQFPLTTRRNADGKMGSYKTRTEIIFRQAESYRLANYWTEASNLYKECYENDPGNYSAALYWYAVCQRSLGNYSSAEESIKKFLSNGGKDSPLYQSASSEKETLQFIKAQLNRPDSVLYTTKKINTAFGNEKGVFAPVALAEDQLLLTSTQANAITEGSNPYHNRLFHSKLDENGLQSIAAVDFESLDSTLNQGAASVSPDGNRLYLTQWKTENGQVVSSIYFSDKKGNGWSRPRLLSNINQPGHNSKQPFCTADGKYLFFASDRKGSKGGFDIWYAALNNDGTAGEPINAGPLINTKANEQAPFYHSGSATLVFASDRMGGMGGYDLYESKGSIAEWKTAENLGYPVNSPRDDVYFFSRETQGLLTDALVSSDRGSECCLATYAITKIPKKKIITGMLVDCAGNDPLADAEVVLKDPDGKIFKTSTDVDGKYSFELSDDIKPYQLSFTREKYNEKTSDVLIESRNETNWQTDTLYHAAVCMEKKFVLKVENVVTVYFDFDKSILRDRGTEQLDSIYNVLLENQQFTIQISAYTDGKGSAAYNKKLSDRRAKACADYLVKKGLDPARISFESFGACCPLEMELINGRDNAEGRSKNRRALINITKE